MTRTLFQFSLLEFNFLSWNKSTALRGQGDRWQTRYVSYMSYAQARPWVTEAKGEAPGKMHRL